MSTVECLDVITVVPAIPLVNTPTSEALPAVGRGACENEQNRLLVRRDHLGVRPVFSIPAKVAGSKNAGHHMVQLPAVHEQILNQSVYPQACQRFSVRNVDDVKLHVEVPFSVVAAESVPVESEQGSTGTQTAEEVPS